MATSFKSVANNAVGRLEGAILIGAGSLTLESGQGALFPASNFWVTLYGSDLDTVHEICLCSSRTGDVLTITRAQQSTTAQAWPDETRCALLLTAQSLADIHTAVNALENGTFTIPNGSNNRVLTATSASALTAESNLVFDGTNLGIGTASPNRFLHAWLGNAGTDPAWGASDAILIERDNACGIQIFTPNNTFGFVGFSDDVRNRGLIAYTHTTDYMSLFTAGAEAQRILSTGQSNFLVGVYVGSLSATVISGNKMDVAGGVTIGSSFAAVTAATSNGLLVEGRIRTADSLIIGNTGGVTQPTGSYWMQFHNGTPSWTAANGIALYCADTSDNTSTLAMILEQVVEAIGTFTASHKIKVIINGAAYWLQLDAV